MEQTGGTEIGTQRPKRLGPLDYFAIGTFSLVLAEVVGVAVLVAPSRISLEVASLIYLVNLVGIALLMLIAGRFMASAWGVVAPWLQPPLLMAAWFLSTTGIPGLATFLYPKTLLALPGAPKGYYSFVASGMALCLVGFTALWIGYTLGFATLRPVRVLRSFGGGSPSALVVLGLYALTVAIRLVRILVTGIAYGAESARLGPLQPFDQWFKYIEDSRYLVLAITASLVFTRRWPWWVLIPMFVAEIVYGFTSGFMKPLIWVIVVVILGFLYSGLSLKKCTGYGVIGLVLAVLIVPVAQELRLRAGNFDQRSPVQVCDATLEAFQSTWGRGPEAGWSTFVDKALVRQASVAQMPGIIMLRTPSEIPYEGAGQFLAIPGYLVPRAIWPDKPILSRGVWFGITYLNDVPWTNSSGAMTVFGESYIFAGWMGTILGLFGLGLVLALLFRNSVSARLVPLYVALAPQFLDYESQLTTKIVALAQEFFVFLAIYWLLLKTPHMVSTLVARPATGSHAGAAESASSKEAPEPGAESSHGS